MKERRYRRSISGQLVTIMLVTVIALVCAVYLTVSYMLTVNYERIIKSEIRRGATSVRQAIEGFVGGAYSLTRELAASPSILSMDGDVQKPMLDSCAEHNDYIEFMAVHGTDGVQTARSDDGALSDHSGRWWFKKAAENMQSFVSRSYFSVRKQRPSVSIFIPMQDAGEFAGVFEMDISLEYLQNLTEQISDSEVGRFSFVMDGEGVVLAHPDSEFIRTQVNLKTLQRTIPRKDKDGHAQFDDNNEVVTYYTSYPIDDSYWEAVNSVLDGNSGTSVITRNNKTYYVSYMPINLPGHSDNWSVITLQDKDVAMEVVNALIWHISVIVFITAAIGALIFIFVVHKKISKPVRKLTETAERISQGELDEEIRNVTGNADEISVMAGAFNRMAEQVRVHTLKESQAQAVTAVRLQFAFFVWESKTIPQAVKMTLAVLRYQYEPLKITIVYTNPKPAYALTYKHDEDGGESTSESEHYAHHQEISALAANKRIIFMNGFTIKEQGIKFAEANTAVACIVPLTAKGKWLGYIILESETYDGIAVDSEESFLLETANQLSGWLLAHRNASLSFADAADVSGDTNASEANDQKKGTMLSALREFDDLDVDTAVETMGGLSNLYEKTIRLFTQVLPESLKRIDASFEEGDMKTFGIEIHGVKGSLSNIGAELSRGAAQVEKFAKSGNRAECEKNYPVFREQLLDFFDRVMNVVKAFEQNGRAKPSGDMQTLSTLLERAKFAAVGFDALVAKDAMLEAAAFAYDPNIDKFIEDIIAALDRFECESAERLIDELRMKI